MAEKRIFNIETEATIDDITQKVYAWFDKKAQQGEVQEPSWKFDVYLLVKILNNFATKFVPNVATVEGKCYWHDGELYVCDTAYTGDWVPGNFTLTSVDELFARKDVLSALQAAVGNLQSGLETTNGNVTSLATYAQNVAGKVDALDKFSVYFEDRSAELAKTTCTILDVGIGNEVELGGYTSSDYKGVFKPCIKGQVFRVKGAGQSSLRLWGFTDGDGVLLEVAPSTASESDYITLFAPADGYIAVNAFGSTGGLLVQSSIDDKAKSVDNDIKDVNDRVSYSNSEGLYYEDKTSLLASGYIALDVGIGNTVTLTPTTSSDFRCASVACKKGQPFKIIGVGGLIPRLWGFTDSESKLVSVCDANVTASDYITVNAPADGYFVMNARGGANPRSLLVVDNVTDKINSIDDETESIEEVQAKQAEITGIFDDVSNDLQNGYYNNSGVIGSVISFEALAADNYKCGNWPCKKGEAFRVKGTAAGRLWGFTDTENKLVLTPSTTGVTLPDYVTLIAPCDGYFFVSLVKNNASYPYGILKQTSVDNDVKSIHSELASWGDVTVEVVTEKQACINTSNIATGDTLDPSYVFESTYECINIPCKAGDVFFVTGRGFSNHRLWLFTDSAYKVLAMANANSAGDNIKIEAPADGYLIYNNYANRYDGWHMGSVRKKVNIEYKLNDYQTIASPWATFNMDTDVVDVSEQYANFNMSNNTNRKLAMEQVYAFMDGLVTNYPSLVTKFDLAEHLGIEYPRYANGISSGDAEYEETPAYKTYCYKISYKNTYIGNDYPWKFRKKKLLWFAGVHGGEVAACVNSAIFAYRLLHDITKDDNLYKILSAFDVYIVPCVNGYGIYHLTRVNANLVNINRNYATPNWTLKGEGTSNYTGPEPESEFETKLVCGLVRELKPDVSIDHHNYSSEKSHCYSAYAQEYMQNTMYELLGLVSCAFKKAYPEYFGTDFSILQDISHNSPKKVDRAAGEFDLWNYTQGVPVCGTFEISDNTMYYGGVATDTGRAGFSPMIFDIGEYTIRAHIVKFCELALRILKD